MRYVVLETVNQQTRGYGGIAIYDTVEHEVANFTSAEDERESVLDIVDELHDGSYDRFDLSWDSMAEWLSFVEGCATIHHG